MNRTPLEQAHILEWCHRSVAKGELSTTTMCQPRQPGQDPTSSPNLDEMGLPVGYLLDDQWEMTPRQVQAMIETNEELVLIDCRTQQEHELVRLANARWVPLEELAGRLHEIKDCSDKKIVVYCHHGVRSLQMTAVLRRFGFASAWSMAGGIDLWAIDIEPEMARY